MQAPHTPSAARRSSRYAAASPAQAAQQRHSSPESGRSGAAVKQEPMAVDAADASQQANGTSGARRTGKRKLHAAAAEPAPFAVKAEPGTSDSQPSPAKAKAPRRHVKAEPPVKQEPAAPAAVKREPLQSDVKNEPVSPLQPSRSTKVKVEHWAAEASAAHDAAQSGKVDVSQQPTAAPLGPFPDFKRPLPDECQVYACTCLRPHAG